VDDEFVVMEEENEEEEEVDGGPLCREGEIESWKKMTRDRRRRGSVQCFGGI